MSGKKSKAPVVSFILDDVERLKYEEWLSKLPDIPNDKFGAIGGGTWFKFRPTGLGYMITVGRDDVPELDTDITNFENW